MFDFWKDALLDVDYGLKISVVAFGLEDDGGRQGSPGDVLPDDDSRKGAGLTFLWIDVHLGVADDLYGPIKVRFKRNRTVETRPRDIKGRHVRDIDVVVVLGVARNGTGQDYQGKDCVDKNFHMMGGLNDSSKALPEP